MSVDPSREGAGSDGSIGSGLEQRQGPVPVRGDLKRTLGYLGSAVLFIGLFLPLIRIPGIGSVNFFWNGGVGVVLLLLTLGSVVALQTRRIWALWLTGAASLVVVAFTLLRVLFEVSLLRGAGVSLPRGGADGPASGLAGVLARGLADAVELEWGWPVLLIGSLLLIASAEIGRREGAAIPRLFWDVVVASSLLVAAIAIGPNLLSGTQQALTEYHDVKKKEVRKAWEPHESAREEMVATFANVREEEGEKLERVESEREAEERARELALARRTARVRQVADVRRWYPSFAASVRPALQAHAAFRRELRGESDGGAAWAWRRVAEEVRGAAKRYPRSPDSEVNTVMETLFHLYGESPEVCRGLEGEDADPGRLARCEEEVGVLLDALAGELAAYCLAVPEGRAASTSLRPILGAEDGAGRADGTSLSSNR